MDDYFKLNDILRKDKPQGGYDAEMWEQIRSAHFGFEAGMELLGMLFLVAEKTSFWDFRVEEDLEVTIPDYLFDADLQTRMKKVLVPPPHHQGRRDRGGVRRHVLRPGGAGPADLRPRGDAFREGSGALHHRSHEDVQHRPGAHSPAQSTRSSSRAATAPSSRRGSRSSRSPRTRSSWKLIRRRLKRKNASGLQSI